MNTEQQKEIEQIQRQLASYDAYYPSDPDLWPNALKSSIEAMRFLLSLIESQDVISREAALKAIRGHVTKYDDHHMHCVTRCIPELIEKLPAAIKPGEM